MNRRYRSSKTKYTKKQKLKSAKTLFIIGLAIVLFFMAIIWFRKSGKDEVVENVEETSVVVDVKELHSEEEDDEPEKRRAKESISLYDVRGGSSGGIATREVDDYQFIHTVVANMPEIPEESTDFYEGWLVREHPFDFFSTGSMDLNADGTYALIWEGRKEQDFWDYNKVVITIEPDDGDPAPAGHVIEGVF